MGSRGGGFYIEYSAEELEELKFIAEVTPYQDLEALSMVDYLNHEHAGHMDIAFSINEHEGIDNQTTQSLFDFVQGRSTNDSAISQDSVVAAEASDKNADEKVITAKADQSENVEDTTAPKEEDTLALAETSDKIVDEQTIIVEPTHQDQNSKDNSSTEREKEDVDVANESTVKKDEPVEAIYDENRDDKMALMIVPLDQGQYIGQSSIEKALIGENYQAQAISVISRTISSLPLHLRLKGWKIREHPRRNLKRKDKFYVHLKSKVQFRSLNEVDDFVHLGFHPKRQIKKLVGDPQNSELQAPKEGPPAKRSTRRVLAWEFYNRKFMNDGTIICDIRFPGSSLGIIEYYNIGSRTSSQETGSSEKTISDRSVNSEGWEELGKEKEEEEEEVQTSFVEALRTLMSMRSDDDNDHDPPPPPPRPQMNNEAEAEAEAEVLSESNSTSAAPSALAGGKRTRDEYDPEEGPISNKPRA